MKQSSIFALTVMVTLAWVAWSCLDYYLTTIDSDCGYTAAEACTRFADQQQQVIVWRGLAVQFAMIIVFLVLRKR